MWESDDIFWVEPSDIAPKPSGWRCYMFGSEAIVWAPVDGAVPNRWVRFWMRIFLGCKWVRDDDA